MRAVVYARFSSDLQQDTSLDDQVSICKERIASEGWHLHQVYRDRAMTGTTSLRPGYQALLEDARQAKFDVVVAEALDRLSRDQEDVAALFKCLQYAGIQLITLAEGEINELHIGLKGTMNALFVKDLANKTRRGMRGRVEAGKSGGGNSYGYKVVKRFDTDGEAVRGDRSVEPFQAGIVNEIFTQYAAGVSPRKIALDLNARGVPAPRRGAWSATTLNGNRARGTGILNNELYVGRLVWNRLRYAKDPATGKRRSRANDEKTLICTSVPELAIVSDELWNAAKARQHALDAKAEAAAPEGNAKGAFWSRQRPRFLFSGLMRCGECGAGFSKYGPSRFACSAARNKGTTVCRNKLSIRCDDLENTVLGSLRHRLMDPALFKLFVTEFTAEWNRQQANAGAEIAQKRGDLDRAKAQISHLLDALMNGTPAAMVNDRLKELDSRRVLLEGQLANAVAPAPRLHPNLAEVYRQKVEALQQALASDDAAQARELLRGLVDAIVLVPEDGALRVEVRGALAAILAISGAAHSKGPGISAEALSLQIKMVAGKRIHRELTEIKVVC
jgi:DNA invertase Pin-like site-specific DNA recombinase